MILHSWSFFFFSNFTITGFVFSVLTVTILISVVANIWNILIFFSLSYRATNLYLNRFGVLIKVKKQMGVVLMKHWQNLLMDMLCYKRRIYTTITKK